MGGGGGIPPVYVETEGYFINIPKAPDPFHAPIAFNVTYLIHECDFASLWTTHRHTQQPLRCQAMVIASN